VYELVVAMDIGRACSRLSGGGLRIIGRICVGDGAFMVMVGIASSSKSCFSSAGVAGAVWLIGMWISIICGLTTMNETTVAVISWDLLLEGLTVEPSFSSPEYTSSKSSNESESS